MVFNLILGESFDIHFSAIFHVYFKRRSDIELEMWVVFLFLIRALNLKFGKSFDIQIFGNMRIRF